MLDLSTQYLGLALKNPLVPSSTPLSHNIDSVLHLEDAGAAAIVMHSLFEEDVRNDERMIDRFLVNPNVFGEATGHLPFGDDYQSKLDGYLENIQQLKSRLNIPVIASLNGSSLSGWVELGKEMQEAGADALELNAWFMPGDPKVSGGALEDNYLALLRELKAAVNLPISMKLSPFFSSLPHFVQQAE
ncbi:MAG: dihydroorotate dehydrogenase-like protein, partial [Azonexus sp.]|nr:dihydroorotate dehydrogenase-like protein [Azonexus sp.]